MSKRNTYCTVQYGTVHKLPTDLLFMVQLETICIIVCGEWFLEVVPDQWFLTAGDGYNTRLVTTFRRMAENLFNFIAVQRVCCVDL